jgi:hypothetical protein
VKIEIILPDGAVAGTLTYFCVDEKEPIGAFLGNVVLNDMADGNFYTVVDKEDGEDG